VLCQIIIAPPRPGSGNSGGAGPVPVWYLVLTTPDPSNLRGPHLRNVTVIGNGTPDYAHVAAHVKAGVSALRELASKRLHQP
jgi:hypothetical protein